MWVQAKLGRPRQIPGTGQTGLVWGGKEQDQCKREKKHVPGGRAVLEQLLFSLALEGFSAVSHPQPILPTLDVSC